VWTKSAARLILPLHYPSVGQGYLGKSRVAEGHGRRTLGIKFRDRAQCTCVEKYVLLVDEVLRLLAYKSRMQWRCVMILLNRGRDAAKEVGHIEGVTRK